MHALIGSMRFLHCVLVILLTIENPSRFPKSSNNDIQFDMLYLPFQLTVQCLLDLQHKRKRVHFGFSCFFPFWIPKMNPFYWVVSGVAWAQYQSKVRFFITHSFARPLFDASLLQWVCVCAFSVAFGLYKIDLMKWNRLQAEITHRHSSIFSSSTSIRYTGYNQNNRFVCQESNSSPHHNHTEM